MPGNNLKNNRRAFLELKDRMKRVSRLKEGCTMSKKRTTLRHVIKFRILVIKTIPETPERKKNKDQKSYCCQTEQR